MKRKLSLQTLKTDLAKKEAAFKTLCTLYPGLKGYSERELLAYFECETFEALQQHIQAIKSPDTLPEEDLEGYPLCSCTDSKGETKYLYETEAEAEKEARALMMHTNTTLLVYPCPSGCGWHLTKR